MRQAFPDCFVADLAHEPSRLELLPICLAKGVSINSFISNLALQWFQEVFHKLSSHAVSFGTIAKCHNRPFSSCPVHAKVKPRIGKLCVGTALIPVLVEHPVISGHVLALSSHLFEYLYYLFRVKTVDVLHGFRWNKVDQTTFAL